MFQSVALSDIHNSTFIKWPNNSIVLAFRITGNTIIFGHPLLFEKCKYSVRIFKPIHLPSRQNQNILQTKQHVITLARVYSVIYSSSDQTKLQNYVSHHFIFL